MVKQWQIQWGPLIQDQGKAFKARYLVDIKVLLLALE